MSDDLNGGLSVLDQINDQLREVTSKLTRIKPKKVKGVPKRKKASRAAKELVNLQLAMVKGEATTEDINGFVNNLREQYGEDYLTEVVGEIRNVKVGSKGSSNTRGPSIDSYDNLAHVRELMTTKNVKTLTGNENELLQGIYPVTDGGMFNKIDARARLVAEHGIKFNSLSVVSATEGEKGYNKTFAEALNLVGLGFEKTQSPAENARGTITRMAFTIKTGKVKPKPEGFGERGAGLKKWREAQVAKTAAEAPAVIAQ